MESIEDHLAGVLGEPVSVSLVLTPARANRKPVLQVFDRHGRTAAFAKLGMNPLTQELVAREGRSLAQLTASPLQTIETPRLLHHGSWNGLEIIVMSALKTYPSRPAGPELLGRAMVELSATTDTGADCTAAGYRDVLADRARDARASLPAQEPDSSIGPDLDAWQDAADRLAATGVLEELSYGAWHGDFTPWNCSAAGRRLLLWDWERYTAPAPVGFDALHYAWNVKVRREHQPFARAAREIVAEAATVLIPWGIGDWHAEATALCYILDLSLRYLGDNQFGMGMRGRHEGQWALPTLHDLLDDRQRSIGGSPRA